MDAIPVIHYFGDRDKAMALKGHALSHYNRVLNSMGDTKTANRTNDVGDGIIINCIINTDAYGNKTGMIRLFVPTVGDEGEAVLFPTSFNDTDLGTQIYKAPYPAKKQGELILANDNPNHLVLPSPTYSARTNYWVNDKENATVSWDYVEYLDASFPIGHIDRKRKYGKIAINGIETGLLWGKFLEPLSCALINDPLFQRVVVVFVDKLNYAGGGTNRYIAVYDYELNFSTSEITLTEIIKVDFTGMGYVNNQLMGFFGDAKRLVIYSTVDRIYYPVDFPLGITIHVVTMNVIEFNAGYTGVLSDEIIYESLPFVSDGYNKTTSGGTTTLIIPTETVSSEYVEVRGNYVSFATKKIASYVETITEASGPYFNYFPLQTKIGTDEYHLISWSATNGLKRDLLKSLSSSWTKTEALTSGGLGVITSIVSDSNWIYVNLYLKKQGEYIYSELSNHATRDYETGTPNDVSTSTTSLAVHSKKNGVIYISDLAVTEAFITDYSYSTKAMVASIETTDTVTGDVIDKSFTLISDFKGEKRKIVNHPTTHISLTKLPKPT